MAVTKDEEPGGLKECDPKHCSIIQFLFFPLNFKGGGNRINEQGKNREQKLFCLSQTFSKLHYVPVHFR